MMIGDFIFLFYCFLSASKALPLTDHAVCNYTCTAQVCYHIHNLLLICPKARTFLWQYDGTYFKIKIQIIYYPSTLYDQFLTNTFIVSLENNSLTSVYNLSCCFFLSFLTPYPLPLSPFILPIRSPSYLNVPTGLLEFFGSTTQTATLEGTT